MVKSLAYMFSTTVERDLKVGGAGERRPYWETGLKHSMLQVSLLASQQWTALLRTGIFLMKGVIYVAVTKPNQ